VIEATLTIVVDFFVEQLPRAFRKVSLRGHHEDEEAPADRK
jgi:hypothetical protein